MSIRLRLTVAFAIVATALFALGSWAFVSSLSTSMISDIDSQLAVLAGQSSTYVRPSTSGAPGAAGGSRSPEYLVQVVGPTGRVRATSAEGENEPILTGAQLAQARRGPVSLTVDREGDQLRVLAEPSAAHPGSVVVAGVSLATYHATVHRTEIQLVLAGAVVALAATAGAFGLATGALRPVERLRREVAALARQGAAGTVAVPGTGDEIAALAETMNELLAAIRSALERERNLIADVSHELRTPFAVLQGELELAARPGRSHQELEDAVARAAEEAGRLSRLADDLLLLSRSDQGQLPLDRRPVDVKEILIASVRQRAERARCLEVTCRLDVPEGLTWDLDPDRIRQAVDNLLDNGLRFAPPGTNVVLAARIDGADLVLGVEDAGPGFPVDFLPHAFERFRRPDASRSRGDGGAGLGLAIVAAIAAAHGGSAAAANRPEGGASVVLRLPAADRADLRP
jgi:signal transduction histidine kinase